MIQTARPFFKNKDLIIEEIKKILETGQLMNGDNTAAFEREFAEFTGTNYAISVNSCTTALEIVLRHLNIRDKEVIVPVNTFVATCSAVLFAGGKPVFADIKDNTYNIGVEEVRKKISRQTKAVVVVHIAGIVCEDILEIKKLCEEYNISLIEDCAHAVGASYGNNLAGTYGLAGCFSFYPTKIITTGTGGMITTNSKELDMFARSVRYHGKSNDSHEIVNVGNNWFMDEIRATLGLYQLRDINGLIAHRRLIAKLYNKKLEKIKGVNILKAADGCMPSFYKYPVQLENEDERNKLKDHFHKNYQIELESVYWPPCHLQPVFRKLFGCNPGDFPAAEQILSKQVTLPIHSLISEKDVDHVVSGMKEFLCV
ncbi:MAG: DegT/DnrJ/EryC1/StrS aminotransferase [Desulfotomaculum sp. 46_296]|nr:MAG: DegT/DnrJ/EryC1/StrS aminotransferase [Desulfotomaculum sp. 46_296]